MAVRPVFVVNHLAPFFRTVDVEFVYNRGLSASQKRKNICAIHEGFNRMYPNPVLEISSKSMQEGGKELSAFNLPKYVASLQRRVPVECAYHAGKVFQNGGPYTDLLSASPRDAKHDPRLKNSGALVGFAFEGQQFPLKPLYLFYNYLYISALMENPKLAEVVLQYRAFTDIEFAPKSSVNCQAAAAATFVSLHKLDLLEQVKNVESFYKLLTDAEYVKGSTEVVKS